MLRKRVAEGGFLDAAAWRELTQPPQDISHRLFWMGFAAIFLLATWLRFWDIGEAALWGDEAITLVQSRLDLATIIFGKIDYHPPLPLILQHFWGSLFPSPQAARVPAALAGIATVCVMMLAVRDLSSKRAALISGLLLAVMTGHVYFSQEARMYALLVLGLMLASWGAAGFSMQGQMRPAQYVALYIAGGLVLIGSHVIGLVLMAVADLIGLAALLDRSDFWARFRSVLIANIGLGILAAPWILQILLSSGMHPGLVKLPVSAITWMVFNMAGFPALGPLSKPFEIILLLLAGAAIVLCWLNNRRTLSVMLLALIVVLPLTLAGLHMFRPVLENRVVLPIVVGIAMGFGIAVSHIRQRAVRLGLVFAITAAALASTVAESADRQKPDDYRGAYTFIDEQGFTGAPVLVCRNYGGAALWFERENDIFYYKPDGVLEQSRPGYWRVAAIPVAQLEIMPAPEIDSRLGGGFLLENGLNTLLARSDRIALIRPFCLRDDEDRIRAALAEEGFVETAHSLVGPGPERAKIITTSRTLVTLFERAGRSSAMQEATPTQP